LRSKEFRNLIAANIRMAEPAEPRCPHFEQCGGCAFQDRNYAGQLEAKQSTLRKLFAEAGFTAPLNLIGSPEPYEYRSRMDYVTTKGRFGLRMRGKFNYIVDLETCHLIPPAGCIAARAVWLRAIELGLPDYNIRTHEGFLRYVVVRRSPTDQFMLAAVTAAPSDEQAAAMEQLAATALAQPGVLSFHWLINDTLTDLSFGTPRQHWGLEHLPMQVAANTLSIGPNTFFQNNLHLLERLLDDVRDLTLAHHQPPITHHPAAVADLYGGVGTIALHLAEQVAELVTVESAGESSDLAAQNIIANGRGNVKRIAADVIDYLRSVEAGRFTVVVVDPPRVGLGPAVCAELLRIRPQGIVYVSCNPLTLLEDLQALAPSYAPTLLQGYDMFPHTPHVEMLVQLEALPTN
jgi:23S rRNA (uracil-5-)-methyltransferase RumA